MALGALHPHAEKQLGHVLELLLRILGPLVPGHGRILDHAPGGSQQLAHDLVVGLVGQQAVPQPEVEGEIRRLVARRRPACSSTAPTICWRNNRRSRGCPAAHRSAGRACPDRRRPETPGFPPALAAGRRCRSTPGGKTSRRRTRAREECPTASGWQTPSRRRNFSPRADSRPWPPAAPTHRTPRPAPDSGPSPPRFPANRESAPARPHRRRPCSCPRPRTGPIELRPACCRRNNGPAL